MEIKMLKIGEIKPYEKNPRRNDEAVQYVANSIKEFGFKVPIVIDKNNIIVTGHTRYKAGKKLGLKEVPCIMADDLTDEQIKAYRLADNKVGERSEWDEDLLGGELSDILNIDMEQFDFDLLFEDDEEFVEEEQIEQVSLADRFGAPPFSILDTRQGYWQKRKREWKQLGIQSEKGRKENLMNSTDLPEYTNYSNEVLKGVAPQTSIFDPVLCELMYKWFNVQNGNIYDCFAGGSVRGIVASKLGYNYTGIDLRQEQIDANKENADELGLHPTWYCDDSQNVDKYLENESVDMIFSCPPYADLEVYSNDPRDISNMDYENFCKVYFNIIKKACNKLKENRFAVFVVGDVRDKKGLYRNFVDYTKHCFNENGCNTYNELILVEQIGTGAMRANKTFSSLRKVIKTHQNVLVFYKGDVSKIKENYGEVFIDNIIEEEIEE